MVRIAIKAILEVLVYALLGALAGALVVGVFFPVREFFPYGAVGGGAVGAIIGLARVWS